jgi:putative MATE family efflux protein
MKQRGIYMITSILKNKTLLKSIIILAIPAIMEMGLNTLLGIADTLMISHFIGSEALAAVGFANQIIFTLVFIFTAFNTGATALISRNFGEKNYERLNKIAGETITVNFIIGLIVVIIGYYFSRSIFSIYDLSQDVLESAISYYKIVIISGIFMFLSFSFAAILRGSGNTKMPMYITGLSNIINIIGNYLLIKGVGIFPEMGVAGAALSTTISRGIACLIYMIYLFSGKDKVKILLSDLKITKDVIKPLWKISYPGAIEQTLMQTSFLVSGIIISSLDTASESAFRILLTIESISFMPAVGLSIAAATLVGKSLGEKNEERAIETGYASSAIGIMWGIFMGIIFLAIPNHILRVFTSEYHIIEISILSMLVAGFNQPFLNFFIVMSGALRGTGDTLGVMVLTSLRLWILFIPLNYLLVMFLDMGVASLWIAEILSFMAFCPIIFTRFRSKKWIKAIH